MSASPFPPVLLSAEVLQVYETLPDPYLLLSPELVVLTASNAYLAATFMGREQLVGRSIADVFPANPDHSSVLGRSRLLESYQRVLRTGQPEQLPIQRYDLPPPTPGSAQPFVTKYWSVLNSPALDPDGSVHYLISKVSDVTELVEQGLQITDLSREVELSKALAHDNRQLVQELQKAQAILDTIQEAYVELSPAGDFTYLNRQAAQLLGRTPAELLGKNIEHAEAVVSPEARNLIRRALATQQRVEAEYLCSTLGYWVYMSVTPTAAGVIVQFYDIRDVKASRNELQREHQRLKESQAIGHIGSFEAEMSTGHVYWSDELYRIHGLEPQSHTPTPQSCLTAMFPEDQEIFMQRLTMSQLLPRFGMVHRILHHDGTVRLVETRTEVERDEQGRVVKVYGTVQDVTEMKQAEKDARESVSQFQTLVENTPDLITRWDRSLRLLFANSAFSQRSGKSLAELLGKTNREMQHPEEIAGPWMAKLRLVLETGQAQDHYNSAPTPTGLKHFYSRLVPETAEDGSVQSVLAIAREITDIKRLEKENLALQLSQQKQLLNAVLETQEFERRRIAESLHNGLAQVLYATKLHLEQIQPFPESPAFRQVLQAKERAGQFLSEAIKATRTISHELIPTTLEDFGLAAAINDVCQHMSHGALRIQCQVTGIAPALDKYLELALYRLVQELVNNIVKHAQATTARVVVAREEGAIRLTAQDNGRGFDPQRLSSKGFGLKTIRDRVKLLGGTTDIVSAQGQGTTVSIWFPVERE
ncbi:PAS domain-containing sensor histidine kinase [Hymenobacter chitinivorans]|uniref:Oxygen sensor histidine kinase NreB n=1 Tax=Hymenobacter chitinivorans DSM 11115 TaxID=1121954 RepID=A0A2M9BLK6_9BACT|nr:PAS domain-containing protein [Hymenobacter chitinivorans]PJJ58837.1 PAS domain S-box-containing protein [Hymenobacter chitinivorans DSM 11115]